MPLARGLCPDRSARRMARVSKGSSSRRDSRMQREDPPIVPCVGDQQDHVTDPGIGGTLQLRPAPRCLTIGDARLRLDPDEPVRRHDHKSQARSLPSGSGTSGRQSSGGLTHARSRSRRRACAASRIGSPSGSSTRPSSRPTADPARAAGQARPREVPRARCDPTRCATCRPPGPHLAGWRRSAPADADLAAGRSPGCAPALSLETVVDPSEPRVQHGDVTFSRALGHDQGLFADPIAP